MAAVDLQPPAGPMDGGTELRVAVQVAGGLELRREMGMDPRHARCKFFDGIANVTDTPLHASSALSSAMCTRAESPTHAFVTQNQLSSPMFRV